MVTTCTYTRKYNRHERFRWIKREWEIGNGSPNRITYAVGYCLLTLGYAAEIDVFWFETFFTFTDNYNVWTETTQLLGKEYAHLFSDVDYPEFVARCVFDDYVYVLTQVSSYCYNGECRTHQSQCRLWWGNDATNGEDICYTFINRRGELGANCGYNFTLNEYKRCSLRYVRGQQGM